MFKKKYEDFVDISIGRIYFKPITIEIYNKCYKLSSLNYKGKILINNAFLFEKFEENLLCLSKRKYKQLLIKDGLKIRKKLKEILLRENLITEPKVYDEDNVDLSIDNIKKIKKEFSQQDKKWFNEQKLNIGVEDGR